MSAPTSAVSNDLHNGGPAETSNADAFPRHWKLKNLGEITLMMTNGFVGKAKEHYTESASGVLYVQGYNIVENGFNLHGVKFVTSTFHDAHQKSCLHEGDLLTIQTGDIGVTAVVPSSMSGSNCHALVISRLDKAKAVPEFYSQLFNSDYGRRMFKQIETGSTMKHLNIGDMVCLEVPVPPVPEQRAIAAALSDVDALIGVLDNLIEKKRAIKLATSQQLLSGRIRLPEFETATKKSVIGMIPSDWDTPRLADLFTFKNGLNKAKEFFGYGTPIVNYMDVYRHRGLRACDLHGRVSLSAAERKNFDVRKGDVFFTRTSETAAEVGISSVMLDDVTDTVFSGFVLRARPKDDSLDDSFKRYCFSTNSVRKQITSQTAETTRALTNGRALGTVVIARPKIEEQRAIASVITDMENEIAAMELHREKSKLIKQGMMQVLLTGKVRLI